MKSFEKLVDIMKSLRGENGCPWDKAQDLDNLKQYIIEESYEVVDAIESGDPEAIKEELGDLILQIVFVARLAQEKGLFDINDVLHGINNKLIHRHPHVFGNKHLKTPDDVLKNWGRQKHKEKGAKIFDIPLQMPSLQASYRLIEKAKRLGIKPITSDKIISSTLNKLPPEKIKKRISHLLLSIVDVAQKHSINPEDILRETNKKIIKALKAKISK